MTLAHAMAIASGDWEHNKDQNIEHVLAARDRCHAGRYPAGRRTGVWISPCVFGHAGVTVSAYACPR